jgi:redox-sensing transcriptional repressor
LEQIPAPAKERLLHLMRILEAAGDGEPLTSAQIEGLTGWSSHTIRKDISFLEAAEGVEPVGTAAGYAPACLVPAIRKALSLDRPRKYCVVGLGRLGSAYLNTTAFSASSSLVGSSTTLLEPFVTPLVTPPATSPTTPPATSPSPGVSPQAVFELVAGFDTSVNRVEILKSPVPLYPAYKMGEVIARFDIEIALLCVPPDAAQGTAEKLAAAGIRGIINFAPTVLRLPPGVAVRSVYLEDELRALAIRI